MSIVGSVKFTNPSKEDLEFTYNSVSYLIRAGEGIVFPEMIGKHGAKKLADRENKKRRGDPKKHEVLINSYLSSPEEEKRGPGRPKKNEEEPKEEPKE